MLRSCCALLGLALLFAPGGTGQVMGPAFRVLSWNVSGRAPGERPAIFRGHVRLADPDIVLLDEVDASLSAQAFGEQLRGARPSDARPWHLVMGLRGGRQRIVIGARVPLAVVEPFQTNSYDAADVESVLAAVPADAKDRLRAELAAGIPVNAATLTMEGRRLLLVAVDLQCCAEEWQQIRRVAEARQVRRLIERAIPAVGADAVILAGDFNLAAPPAGIAGIGILPFIILSGPYPAPVHGLVGAEALQRDGREAWTISSGKDSPFPHMPFDFQLYSPGRLRVARAYVMDTADYQAAELARVGLTPAASADFSMHRPVVVTYEWTAPR
jgi:hypothetical protein